MISSEQEYQALQTRLGRGWNTWNTRSVLSHVLLPQGFALNLCLKEYTRGHYLKEALIGRQGAEEERILPGAHAYDAAYTDLSLAWRGIELRVQSALAGEDLVLLVTPRKLPYTPPTLVVESGLLWNRPGMAAREGEALIFYPAQPAGVPLLVYAAGELVSDAQVPAQTPYLALRLEGPAGVSTGRRRSLAEIQAVIQQQAAAYEAHAGDELRRAIQTCLAWDTIYEPAKERVVTPVSRIWNCNWGGYVLFEWDTYFAAALAAVDNKDLAYANAVEMTRERTESGLVPNFASPLGASRDRSEPPVGALIVRELYRRFGDRWLVECVFDDLLAWNRWWHAARSLEGLLCWGSTPYTPRFGSTYEVNDVNNRQGAAYESGLDNSPMYDDVPFDADSHLMQLWDVGLNGLYVADCQALAALGRALGRAEVEELEARGTAYASRLQSLWSEADGIFLNRPPQAGDFSAPAGRRLSPTNFYPLIGQAAAPKQAERMIREHFYNPQEFWGEWMLASIARNDPAYPEQHYWRGRIWGPMNYLVYLGLRNYCGAGSAAAVSACQDLAAKSEALLLKEWRVNGHVHENYNAITGEGCDSSSSDRYYHWGALLALIPLLAREDLP